MQPKMELERQPLHDEHVTSEAGVTMGRIVNPRAAILAAISLLLFPGALFAAGCDSGAPTSTARSVSSDPVPATQSARPVTTTKSSLPLADEDLHPVGVDGKIGYIDGSGRVVIEPQFQRAEIFSEGLAPAGVGDTPFSCRWGYIDKAGAWVIQPQFGEGLGAFTEGLAVIQQHQPDGSFLYGYIDKTGDWVIEPRFTDAKPFSEGLACVATDDAQGMRRYGYIDKTGTFVIDPQFDLAFSFSEGLAAVRVPGKHDLLYWGYIEKTGAWVIKPTFDLACSFSEGLAFVSALNGRDGYDNGCVDKTGVWVFKLDYHEELKDFDMGFSEGLAAVGINTKRAYTLIRYGYVDKSGAWVIEPQFEFARPFSEGLAEVSVIGVDAPPNPGRAGYIGKTGTLVVQPQYLWGDPFSGGLALVAPWDDEIAESGMWYPPDKYRYIDTTGAVVWPGG
jgi:hypothetical protein